MYKLNMVVMYDIATYKTDCKELIKEWCKLWVFDNELNYGLSVQDNVSIDDTVIDF